ncbi:DUF4055 domain-containing protein [Cupriavidus sp. 2TAF22]|uniref:DUF4055 domain-containing protein n=1 Tax=unclassified Cupriavidus TaxID=2640874 RepID=UPI003F92AD14
MPVDTKHPDYTAALPKWQKCRDLVKGEEAVHAKGEVYLPKLSGQDDDAYGAYKMRAMLYNATGRTLEALTGLVFRRPPTLELPAGMAAVQDDADSAGTPLLTLCERVVDELLQVGRFGLLVDYPTQQNGAITVGQAESMGLRPFAAVYTTEAIINWSTGRVGNQTVLTQVVLVESVEVRTDEFTVESKPQYRVLDLLDGVYRVRLYRPDIAQNVPVSEIFPLMQGKPMGFIPFVICNPNGISWVVAKPPMLDLVNVNLSHYRGTADYEHGLHFTGLPTAVITGHSSQGVNDDGTVSNEMWSIGSGEVWVLPEQGANAFYLEFQGAGLTQLKDALQGKIEMMVTLGARMLAQEKKQAEAAQTAEIHRSGENSVLASVANAASAAITRALEWMRDWMGQGGDVGARLNTDFLPTGLTAQEITALVAAWMQGAISWESLFDNLVRGEVVADGTTADDERARIDAGMPALAPRSATPPAGGE